MYTDIFCICMENVRVPYFFCTYNYTLREFELSLRLGLKFGKTKMGVCPLHVGPFTLDWLGSTT